MSNFTRDIGIDLGTANTLVHLRGKGIVVREPSVVAINCETKQILAVGDDAKAMLGRTPGNIVAIRPMKDGVIADYNITQNMIRKFIQKAYPHKGFLKPRIIVCIPSGATEVEKHAIEESVMQAGAREVHLIEEPMAAAIGAELPVDEPVGSMVVDIGGGTSEVAVISLGGIVTSLSLRVAGDELDNSIVQYVRKKYSLLTGERTAETVKIKIGSAYPMKEEKAMDIKGRDLVTGLPKTITITSLDVREALSEPVNEIVEAIKNTLEQTPPELAADIMENGIMLTGGGALLRGLDRLILLETGIKVNIAETPLDCVALGTAQINTFRGAYINKKKK